MAVSSLGLIDSVSSISALEMLLSKEVMLLKSPTVKTVGRRRGSDERGGVQKSSTTLSLLTRID